MMGLRLMRKIQGVRKKVIAQGGEDRGLMAKLDTTRMSVLKNAAAFVYRRVSRTDGETLYDAWEVSLRCMRARVMVSGDIWDGTTLELPFYTTKICSAILRSRSLVRHIEHL